MQSMLALQRKSKGTEFTKFIGEGRDASSETLIGDAE